MSDDPDQSLIINYDEIEIIEGKELGKGGYAHVKLARMKKSNKLYAVKIVRRTQPKNELIEPLGGYVDPLLPGDRAHEKGDQKPQETQSSSRDQV